MSAVWDRPESGAGYFMRQASPRGALPISEDGDGLIFLLGPPRSGTTLLALLLGQHPEICSPPEPWLMFAVEALGKVPLEHPAKSNLIGAAFADFTRTLDLRGAQRACAVHLYNQALKQSGARVFLDKTPRYHLIAPFLADLFPRAKFIVLTRNPLARLASMKQTWRFSLVHALGDTPGDELVADFALAPRLLLDFTAQNAGRCLCLSYERLVLDSTATYAQALSFIGARPAPVPETFAAEGAGYTGSRFVDPKIFGAQSIRPDSLESWKSQLSRRELKLALALLGAPLLDSLGYGGLIEELSTLGIFSAAPETTARLVGKISSALSARWRATEATATQDPAETRSPFRQAWMTARRRAQRLLHAIRPKVPATPAPLAGAAELMDETSVLSDKALPDSSRLAR
jgi:hypothetical protein